MQHWDKPASQFWLAVRGSEAQGYAWFLSSMPSTDSLTMAGVALLIDGDPLWDRGAWWGGGFGPLHRRDHCIDELSSASLDGGSLGSPLLLSPGDGGSLTDEPGSAGIVVTEEVEPRAKDGDMPSPQRIEHGLASRAGNLASARACWRLAQHGS